MIGKKGYVFTLDITIAVVIVMGLLMLSALIMNRAQAGTFLEMEQMRIANDVITIMDNQGVLQSGNTSLINSVLKILPSNFNMSIVVKTYGYDGSNFVFRNRTQIGSVTNETNRFIGQGKRTFITMGGSSIGNYSTVEYNIWVK